MFEKYGAMDFFCGVRRYIKYLLLICLVGFLAGMININAWPVSGDTDISKPGSDHASYINSNSICFTYDDLDKIGENGVDYLKLVASSAYAYLHGDFARQYVFDYLDEKYGLDYVRDLFAACEPKFVEDDFGIQSIKEYFCCKLLDDGVTINYWLKTPNETLTDLLLEGYTAYVSYLENEIFVGLKCLHLGGAKQVEKSGINAASLPDEATPSQVQMDVKRGILGAVLLGSFFVVGIFAYTLLFPRMNRKSDFVNYNVRVLGEFRKKGMGQQKMALKQQCLRIENALQNKRVVVLTSTLGKKAVRYVFDHLKESGDETCKFLEYDEEELDYQKWYDEQVTAYGKCIILLPSILIYETALQIAKRSDAVVLVEEYGNTTYKLFERTVELANEVPLSLSGVIGIY